MLTHRTYNKGSRRQEGWERELQNSVEQRHEEICGRERDGVGYMGLARWTVWGLSGKKTGNLNEVGMGWISGSSKVQDFGWGKIRDGGEQLF